MKMLFSKLSMKTINFIALQDNLGKFILMAINAGDYHNDSRDQKGRLLPAVIYSDGYKAWYQNGKLHNNSRDDNGNLLPAEIYPNGGKEWWQNGKRHNDDRDEYGKLLPAIIQSDGNKEYYLFGKEIKQSDPEFQISNNQNTLEKQELTKELDPLCV
jgi:hypothetical protein